ncbi:hypothetical protein MMC24_006360 [Lignoscripta atroalba]|nr:hypothetical protein [Lignoscripta atroalba]
MFSALSIHLELARPPLSGYPSRDTKSKNLLIYGGSSSCGGLGIKYASDAGYTVVTTSSPRNRSFVLKQGAAQVIDHTQPADAIVVELKAHGPYEAVLDCISLPGTFHIMSNLMSEKGGVIYGLLPPDGFVFPPNVEYKFFPYSWVLEEDANSHMARWFYDEYVPRGLVSGQIIPTRHVLVAGGLGNVQQTLDQMADGGVSGHKYVLNPQL